MCINSHPTRVTVNCGPTWKVRSGISIDRVVDRLAVVGDRLRYNMPGHCVCRCGAVRYQPHQPHMPPPATSTPPPAAPPPATPPSRCTVRISRTIVLQYPSLCVCIYIYVFACIYLRVCMYARVSERGRDRERERESRSSPSPCPESSGLTTNLSGEGSVLKPYRASRV